MKNNYLKTIRFLASGISAAAVEYIVFLCLHAVIGDEFLVVSQSASFLCGFVVSFSLNRSWVFKSHGDKKNELIKYSSLAIVNLILSNIIIWVLVSNLSIVFWIAKFLVMASIATWNYFIFQMYVFKNKD